MNMHIETFTEGKKTFVKLPAEEFSRLMEMLEILQDVKAVRDAKGRIALGEKTVPATVAYALAAARHAGKRIRIWREHRDLSKADLASEVGLTGQYIGMIEAGKRKGTVGQLAKIADALDCNLDDLV